MARWISDGSDMKSTASEAGSRQPGLALVLIPELMPELMPVVLVLSTG
jgi:hypothetical protein